MGEILVTHGRIVGIRKTLYQGLWVGVLSLISSNLLPVNQFGLAHSCQHGRKQQSVAKKSLSDTWSGRWHQRRHQRRHQRTTYIKNVGLLEDVLTMEPLFASGVENMVAFRCIAAGRIGRILLATIVTMRTLEPMVGTAV